MGGRPRAWRDGPRKWISLLGLAANVRAANAARLLVSMRQLKREPGRRLAARLTIGRQKLVLKFGLFHRGETVALDLHQCSDVRSAGRHDGRKELGARDRLSGRIAEH